MRLKTKSRTASILSAFFLAYTGAAWLDPSGFLSAAFSSRHWSVDCHRTGSQEIRWLEEMGVEVYSYD